jgi:hypothetical protein
VESYQNRNRPDKVRLEREAVEDTDLLLKKGDRARLTELIKWARWSFYCLFAIGAMASLFFIRDAVTVILRLFGV